MKNSCLLYTSYRIYRLNTIITKHSNMCNNHQVLKGYHWTVLISGLGLLCNTLLQGTPCNETVKLKSTPFIRCVFNIRHISAWQQSSVMRATQQEIWLHWSFYYPGFGVFGFNSGRTILKKALHENLTGSLLTTEEWSAVYLQNKQFYKQKLYTGLEHTFCFLYFFYKTYGFRANLIQK